MLFFRCDDHYAAVEMGWGSLTVEAPAFHGSTIRLNALTRGAAAYKLKVEVLHVGKEEFTCDQVVGWPPRVDLWWPWQHLPPCGLSLSKLLNYMPFFCSIRQAALRGLSHICVVGDDEAAFHTVKSGRVSGRVWARVRLLRRINRICASSQLHLQLALTPSASNPADRRLFSFHSSCACVA